MQRKDGLPKKHGGGRKRTLFCDPCKTNPIPIRKCNPCKAIYWANWRKNNPERNKELARNQYARNKKSSLAQNKAWKLKNLEKISKQGLIQKDQKRYGEFASAHRTFINLRKLMKETKND